MWAQLVSTESTGMLVFQKNRMPQYKNTYCACAEGYKRKGGKKKSADVTAGPSRVEKGQAPNPRMFSILELQNILREGEKEGRRRGKHQMDFEIVA